MWRAALGRFDERGWRLEGASRSLAHGDIGLRSDVRLSLAIGVSPKIGASHDAAAMVL